MQLGGQGGGNRPGQGVVLEFEFSQGGQAAEVGNRPVQLVVVELEALQGRSGQLGSQPIERGCNLLPVRIQAELVGVESEILQLGQGAEVGNRPVQLVVVETEM